MAFAAFAAGASLAALHWRRLAQSVSQAEIDADVASNLAEAAMGEWDEDSPAGAVALVARAQHPPLPGRPWFWHVAVPGQPDTSMPGVRVDESSGWERTEGAANAAADDAIEDICDDYADAYGDGTDL